MYTYIHTYIEIATLLQILLHAILRVAVAWVKNESCLGGAWLGWARLVKIGLSLGQDWIKLGWCLAGLGAGQDWG